MKLIEKAVDFQVYILLKGGGSEWVKAFDSLSGLSVLFSSDKTPKGVLKHISISHFDRYPTWDELLEIKNQLLGDIDAMMVMPKKKYYVNVSKNCFHIWETPTEWGIL